MTTFRNTAGYTFRSIAGTFSRFRFEIGRNSLYVCVPFVGALWVGGGMPACWDSWATLRATGEA